MDRGLLPDQVCIVLDGSVVNLRLFKTGRDCLLFVLTDVLAVGCTAKITWDPGGGPVLRRNMRKLDR